MLLRAHVEDLLNLTVQQLNRIVRNSGYKDAKFDDCEFVGITNSGDWCYKVSYYEDGGYDFAKIYVKRDTAGNFVAEF
jgi:hypothetical protein